MKKRPFLMPVAFSMAALLGTAVVGNALATSLFPAKGNPSTSSMAGAASSSDFVIKSASSSSQFAQHASHDSHGSHSSHGSHASHSSHGSAQ